MGALSGRPGPDPSAEHGTRSRYQAGCDCSPCRDANAVYIRDLRLRRNRWVRPYNRKSA